MASAGAVKIPILHTSNWGEIQYLAFCSLPLKVVLKEEKKKKEKDNQYKLKKAMAIAIGLK